MATRVDHKNLSRSRLKSVEILIDGQDWDMAGYLMGYVLECALKAAVCKTLKLAEYPDNITNDNQARSFFQTHNFDRLLMLSGMVDLFKLGNSNPNILRNWSEFTFNYDSNWPEKRYQPNYWTETMVRQCYNCLTDKPFGIINQIVRKRRW